MFFQLITRDWIEYCKNPNDSKLKIEKETKPVGARKEPRNSHRTAACKTTDRKKKHRKRKSFQNTNVLLSLHDSRSHQMTSPALKQIELERTEFQSNVLQLYQASLES